MWKYAVLVLAAGAAIAIAMTRFWDNAEPEFADAGNAALVAQGKIVYADQCASCHGANLEGQPNWRQRRPDGRLPAPPHDETGHTWHHPDAHLFQVTKFGTASIAGPNYETDMAAFGEILSDAEIWAVLAFIKSRWPAAVRRRHAELNRAQN